MKRNIFLGLCIMFCNSNSAQMKQLTEQQMIRNGKTNVVVPLPQVLGWVNDESFLINKKAHPDSAFKPFLVDCKTGKQTPASTELLKKETPDAYSKIQMECMTSKGKRVAKMARLLLKSI